jgi:oligopeptide transport system substrate-binding protein
MMKNLIENVLICAVGIVSFSSVWAADPNKVIRVASTIAETSFDPAFASDEISQFTTERVFDSMLEYDYLARPVKVVPRTLIAPPEISDGGKTITAKIQPGIFFSEHVAFGGKKRELTAADYAYSLKRLIDPKVKSPWYFLVEGKIVGVNEAREAAQKAGKFDYDAPISGLGIVDRMTLRIKLTAPDFNFQWILAMPSTGAVAREVVEKTGDQIGANPIGTGPFILGEYKRASKTTLLANPTYRKRVWDWKSSAPEDQAMIQALKGKTLPLVGKVELYVIEEGQALWLAFLNGEHDYINYLPPAVVNLAKTGRVLKPELAAKGMRLREKDTPAIYYDLFNMTHPILGGYTKERIALRRAIQYAFPLDEFARVVFNGDAEATNGVVPQSLAGFNPKRPRAHIYDVEVAKKLLDKFGYVDRDGDGLREQPDGSPLVIDRTTGTSSLARQQDELWERAMKAIGIKITFNAQKVPDRRKAAREGKATTMTEAWNADYPDAENFLQLLYGRNVAAENYARFKLDAFDDRYEKIRLMPNSPERDKIIDEMQDLVVAYAPWINLRRNIDYTVEQPWLVGFKKNPIAHDAWEYMDIDLERKAKK